MDLSMILGDVTFAKATFTAAFYKSVTIIAILILLYISVKIGSAIVDKFVERQKKLRFSFDERKTKTLGEVLKSILRYCVYFLGLVAIFEQLFGTITLTFAGIGGVALGFASQSVIKDIINGFFILFEDHFSVGDFINVDDKAGVVESIELRITKIRDFNGDLHIIPNGLILKVTNHSRGNMRFIVEVGVAVDANTEKVLELISKTCEEFKEKNENVTEGPKILGISNVGENTVTIKVMGMAKSMKQFECEMLLRKEIKGELDKNKIATSYRRVVAVKVEE